MESIQFVEHYLINPDTMALFPMDGPLGEHWTIIIEVGRMIQAKDKPLTIIDQSCSFFGSSYKGRKEGVAALMNYTHMAPITICDAFDIILFPLTSPTNRDCIWLVHKHIKKWQYAQDATTIQFTNHQVKTLPIHYGTFEMKLHRAAQYRCKLLESIQYFQSSVPRLPINQPINLEETIQLKSNRMFSFI